MRILVTGGAGFIGSNLADAFLERGHDVLVVDDLSTGKRENVPGRCCRAGCLMGFHAGSAMGITPCAPGAMKTMAIA